jgi:hypothetical protein
LIATFRVSTNPESNNPCRKAETVSAESLANLLLRNPMTGTPGCCAQTASGHPTAAVLTSVKKSRRGRDHLLLFGCRREAARCVLPDH